MLKLFIKLIIIIGIAAALYFVITGKNLSEWLEGQAPAGAPEIPSASSTSDGWLKDVLHTLGL